MKINHSIFLLAVGALLGSASVQSQTVVVSDNYNITTSGTGFALGSGVNTGINPPTTRMTGTAAANLRYMFITGQLRATSKYDISSNRLRCTTDSANTGRFTISANGATAFDFGPYVGSTYATPANPAVYDIKITMRNDATTTARFSFALTTVEGDANTWDFGLQMSRTNADYYTIWKRFDNASTGTPADINLPMFQMQTGSVVNGGAGTLQSFVIRVTDAGAESGASYNSRIQVSTNNGTAWQYDTASDTATVLTNGFRFDGPARMLDFDQAANGSGTVFYDSLSITSISSPAPPTPVTWTGQSVNDSNWTTPENWGGSAPQSGQPLVFDGTSRQTNNNDFAGFDMPYLTLNTAGWSLSGNAFSVSSTISNIAGVNTIGTPLSFTTTGPKNWVITNGSELVLTNTTTVETNGDHTIFGGGTLHSAGAFNIGVATTSNPAFSVLEGIHLIDGAAFSTRGGYRIGSQPTGAGGQTILTNNASLTITATSGNLRVGDSANSHTALLSMDNSTLTLNGSVVFAISYATGAKAAVNQNGGAVSVPVTSFSESGAGTGTYAITNGTLTTRVIRKNNAGGTASIYFNNATLSTAAGASNALFFIGLNLARIEAGGLVVDAQSDITIGQVLSGPGGITKSNSASLTLTGANTFSGTLAVNSGIVSVGLATALPANSTVNLNGGTLDLANSATVTALQYAGVIKAAGTYGAIGSGAAHENAQFTGAGILTVTGGGVSTTTVTSGNPNELAGQTVNFTITVTGTGDGSVPDGTVDLYDNNVLLAGALPLTPTTGSSAAATFSTSSLPLGSHPITATWVGNTSYSGSTSPVYAENIVQAPVITSPAAPSTITNNAGTTLALTVAVQDATGVTYQWKKGGVNLSNGSYSNAATVIGSTAATLTLVGVKAADASPGDYTCAVTNAAGNALSPTITLVVNDPAISVQPTNSIFECGSNGCLSVTAAGTTNANGVLTYQWYTPNPSGTAIVNATNSTLCFNTVHFSDVGSYSVVVSNGFGNSITSQVAVVTVQDTTKPVLVGVPSDTTADCSAIPSPASVTATDTCDSNPGVNLVTVTNAGSCAQGYAIVRTWTAMDASGNTSSVSQTITVTDTTPPVITLTGGASITHECHTAYVDPGYSANDACAGPVGVTPSGVLDANTLGDYTLTYSASDPCNNGTSLTRVVHVLDTTPPVISLISGTNSLCKHTAYVDPGATATDLCSATVTITTNGVIDTNTPGFYTLTYTAIDASLNSTTSNRVVQVLDCGDPVAITSISTLNSLIVKVPDGTNVEFSVTTTGTDPKTYKWYVKDVRDGGPGTFLFQTISNQVSIGASAVDRTPGTGIVIKTNSYYVVVDNFLTEPQTSGTTNVSIVVDNKSPAPLVLTSPAKNGKYGSGTPTLPFKPYAITGTATDPAKGHIAHVRYYYINSNTPPFVPSAIYEAPLVDKNAGTTGDSIVLFNITTNPPLAGTNLIAIWPVDLAGNPGKGVTNAFFYSIPIPFTLHKVGDGTGAVSFVDKMGDKVNTSNIVYFGVGTVDKTVNMNEGETYTLSYTPDRTTNNVKNLPSVISVVTNAPGWGGPTNSIKKYTGPAITVEPTTNSVSFEFDRDRFVDMAGNYNAVLTADTNNPTLGTSRYLHLTVAKSRVATGYLMDAAHVHDAFAVHSSVDSAGHLHLQTALNSIVIDGDLAWTGSENPTGIKQFTGSVTFVNTSNAVVVADLEDKNALPTPGFATMSIPGVNNNPGGSGIATHKLLNGSVTSIYTLGDDDKHPATWPLKGSRSGNIPQWIITKTGVLFGNMNATDGLSNVIAPSLSWIRNPTPVLGYTYANLLPGGFVNSPFAAVASHYDNSVHPGLTGAFTLSLSGGGLANDTNTTLIFSGNTFTTNAPSPVTGGKVDPVSGKLTVIFLDGLPSKHKTTALGVVLQNATNGAGFFIRGATTIPTNSGSLTLTPQ